MYDRTNPQRHSTITITRRLRSVRSAAAVSSHRSWYTRTMLLQHSTLCFRLRLRSSFCSARYFSFLRRPRITCPFLRTFFLASSRLRTASLLPRESGGMAAACGDSIRQLAVKARCRPSHSSRTSVALTRKDMTEFRHCSSGLSRSPASARVPSPASVPLATVPVASAVSAPPSLGILSTGSVAMWAAKSASTASTAFPEATTAAAAAATAAFFFVSSESGAASATFFVILPAGANSVVPASSTSVFFDGKMGGVLLVDRF
mmetsp:Transcript_16248/g.32335  ORF Transcript_16248/g.32335 Transcript_16248/m.32335 type:complete len:261 (-) Transcript_16248:411-1193(-)